MPRKKYNSTQIFLLLALLFCSCGRVNAQNVPYHYKSYFVKFKEITDNLSFLDALGLRNENEEHARSFALICGISKYPKMGLLDKKLAPAAEDVQKMKNYLLQNDYFDEIVVLENSDVTLENLQYFLQSYFPDRLKKFPNSRFLFAYSGHGITENNKGYLLESTANSFFDKAHAINLDVLHVYLNEVIAVGHHVLVLLNSCYGGSLLKRSYGGEKLTPKYPGAHAITAGSSGELTFHDGALGKGSVFFEKIIAGLSGIADTHADGIITAHELAAYLIDEIRSFSNQNQNPQWGDISLHGSQGEFFFLNKKIPVTQGYITEHGYSQSMGGPQQSNNSNDEDRRDWKRLSALGIAGLKVYLGLHPNGKWVNEARSRIAAQPPKVTETGLTVASDVSVRKHKPLTSKEQDQAFYDWQQNVQFSESSSDIKKFLEKFPEGKHVQAAQRRYRELRNRELRNDGK